MISWKTEDRSWKTENRRPKSEVGRRKTEDISRKTGDGSWKIGVVSSDFRPKKSLLENKVLQNNNIKHE